MHGETKEPALMTACEAAGQTRLSYGKPATTNSFAKTIQTPERTFLRDGGSTVNKGGNPKICQISSLH